MTFRKNTSELTAGQADCVFMENSECRALAKEWGKIIVRRHWAKKGPSLDVDFIKMEEVAMVVNRQGGRG